MISKYQDISRFGADGLPGTDQSGAIITGPRVVGERIAARWLRDPDSVIWDGKPESACGLLRYLNADLTASEVSGLRAKLLAAAQAEDGVLRASVTITDIEDGLQITGSIVTDEGSVELNVDASGAVTILAAGAIL